ncbi:RPS16-2 [Symbiodinium sp. CCMP2456]|nr:RPS16-2 [Symbiodinium sp. CCMP2456]
MLRSSICLVRKMFLPFYSKERGPPKIRQQVVGTRGRRFFKLVACNQRDPQNGKHMEVLGSYAPKVKSNIKEIRLRFSRVKFWIGVGAQFNPGTRQLLALAGLIPTPPPLFGHRTKGHYKELQKVLDLRQEAHEAAVQEYHKHSGVKGIHAAASNCTNWDHDIAVGSFSDVGNFPAWLPPLCGGPLRASS